MGRNKIAVVGIGGWGKNIVRVCAELEILVAICDQDSKKCALYSYEYNVPAKTWTEILADKTINAVVIVLPANLHEQYTTEALLANKHVFVEKPLAMSHTAAQELSRICLNHNKILMVGHILQYHNAYIKLKQLILNGVIGEIKYIESTRLHLGPVRPKIGIIWELMPHDISMILGINSAPVIDIKVHTQNLLSDCPDLIDVNLKFSNNVEARVYSSWLHPKKEQKFWVAGTKGMLIFEDTLPWENKLKLYKYDNNQQVQPVEMIELVADEPLKAEMCHFMACINNSKISKTDAEEGTKVVQILQQIAAVTNIPALAYELN